MPDVLGAFAWSEFDRLIVLSPHLDDAVLSCAGLLTALRDRVERLVVTICAGDPGDVAGTSWLARPPVRRREDRAAMKALACPYLHLGFRDAVYRRSSAGAPLYPRGSFLGPVHRDDEAHLVEVQRVLSRLCNGVGRVLVVSPLGVGGHVDHTLCARAACQLAGGDTQLLFYEEFPYSVPGNRLTADRSQTPGAEERIAALGKAPERRLLQPFDVDAKSAIVQHYATQIPMLFGDPTELRRVLAATATTPAEIYWTVRDP